MRRQIILSACLLIAATSQAQTLSNCRTTPPPVGTKPAVGNLSLSRDGNTLVVAGGEGKIRFLDMQSGTVRRTLTGHTNMAYNAIFSRQEKLMASSSRDHTARIWDVATGRELHQLGGFRCAVKTVAFSPDERSLAGAGNDGMVKIWDVNSGKELKSLVHLNSADIDMSVYSVAFSRDGSKIYAGNGDGTISEWEIDSGKETKVWKAHDHTAFRLIFSPDYRVLASFGDSVVNLWETSSWGKLESMSMIRTPGLADFSSNIAFSHDGNLIAASNIGLNAKQDAYVYVQTIVWNAKTGEKLFTLEGHKLDVNGLVFTRDDRYLLTGSVDGTIKFWDMKTGQLARTISLPPAGSDQAKKLSSVLGLCGFVRSPDLVESCYFVSFNMISWLIASAAA
jgi:WD40 repeat protein